MASLNTGSELKTIKKHLRQLKRLRKRLEDGAKELSLLQDSLNVVNKELVIYNSILNFNPDKDSVGLRPTSPIVLTGNAEEAPKKKRSRTAKKKIPECLDLSPLENPSLEDKEKEVISLLSEQLSKKDEACSKFPLNTLGRFSDTGGESRDIFCFDSDPENGSWTSKSFGETPVLERQEAYTNTQEKENYGFTPLAKIIREESCGGMDTTGKRSSSSTISTDGYHSPSS